jgi:regulator of replication initiation timing
VDRAFRVALDALGHFRSTLDLDTFNREAIRKVLADKINQLQAENGALKDQLQAEHEAPETAQLRAENEALKARLAETKSSSSNKAVKAAEMLAAGEKADVVARKIGYKGDNARSSLYTLLRRRGTDIREVRKGAKSRSGRR